MRKRRKERSVFGEEARGPLPGFNVEHMIGKRPPEEIRYFLPWGGHSPCGEEILEEARVAWEARAK